MSMNAYERIAEVLRKAGRPLAPHEFANYSINTGGGTMSYQSYVGCSESALARRMREMVQMGLLTSKYREGVAYKEFAVVSRESVAV